MRKVIDYFSRNPLLSNMLWLFFDKAYGAILTLWIFSLLAKYLGTELFGVWNYIIAFGALIPAFSGLGLNFIIVKKLKETKSLTNRIVSAGLFLRLIAGILISLIFLIIYKQIDVNSNEEYFGIVILIFISQITLNTNIFIFKNEADLENKKTVLARNISLTIAFVIRFLGIQKGYGLLFFAMTNIIENTFFLGISFLFYKMDKRNLIFAKYDPKVSMYLFKQGLPLLLASITVVLYLKIDQLIIAYLLDNKSVALYSAASRITEMLYAVPAIIASVFYPKIIDFKNSLPKREAILSNLYGITIATTVLIIVAIHFTAEHIIYFIFGIDYSKSSDVLVIYSWSIFFMGLLVTSSKFLLVINRNDIILKRSILGLVSNVALNFLLIPLYGIKGAAWATIFSYALASYFSNIFFRDLRPVMLEQLKSVFLLLNNIKNKNE